MGPDSTANQGQSVKPDSTANQGEVWDRALQLIPVKYGTR
jgi:hypothetical protein